MVSAALHDRCGGVIVYISTLTHPIFCSFKESNTRSLGVGLMYIFKGQASPSMPRAGEAQTQ